MALKVLEAKVFRLPLLSRTQVEQEKAVIHDARDPSPKSLWVPQLTPLKSTPIIFPLRAACLRLVKAN